MNKIRIITILLSTLLIGAAIGFFGNGWLHHRRMMNFLQYRTEAGFKEVALDMLQPAPEQMHSLNPIIEEYARLNRELNFSYRRDLEALQMSYFNELEPYLTEKQFDKLVGTHQGPGPNPPVPTLERPKRPQPDSAGFPANPGSKKPTNKASANTPDTSASAKPVPQNPDTNLNAGPGSPGYNRPGPGPEGVSPEERAERISLNMKQRLQLDEPQYEQVRQINLEYATGMKAIHIKYKGSDHRGMMQEVAGLDDQRNASMKAVLSPSQYESYLLMIERIKKAWIDNRRRR